MRQLDLYKYNPGQCDPEDLEATFVAREAILENILGVLRERAAAPTNQHFLIIGPRGIGKTNLLLLAKHRVQNDDALKQAYIALQTAEEEYSIVSLRDFFSKVLELLLEVESNDDLRAAAESAASTDNDEHAAEIAIDAVRRYSERSRKKILLLLDNFDLILDAKILDEAQMGRLRDVLMNGSFLALVATAPTHFKEVSGYDRPFYQFFHPIELKDLSIREMTGLLRKQAVLEKNETLLDRFKELQPRIQAVHHLTGGNPRLVLMLYQLYTRTELPEVRASIQTLLDDLTPYYKHRMEDLSPQQRKVLDTFARLGRPATPTELAEETRLPVNQINSILKRLRVLGFVSISPQKRRKITYYMVSERVFRIWHQMRFSTVGRRKLEFFIEFLRIWYTEKEWIEESNRLIDQYRSTAAEKQFAEAGRFIEHLEYLTEAAPRAEMGYFVTDATTRACIESGDFKRAEEMLNERIVEYSHERNNDRLAQSWYLMAYLRNKQDRAEDEMVALEKAVQFRPEFAEALYNWGCGLGYLAHRKEGEEQERLLRLAFEKYEAAVKVKPDKHEALNNWGYDLGYLAHRKEGEEQERLFRLAFEKYEAAVKVKVDFHEALNNWGNDLGNLARTKEGAEQEELFEDSLQKISQAIKIASSQEDQERAAFYSAHFVHVNLLRCEIAIKAENSGQARRIFDIMLDHLPQAREDLALHELLTFFRNVLDEQTARICAELFALMRDGNMDKVLGVLEPISVAVEYWQEDERTRDEVLDRLNPEVREVVEAIIQGKAKSLQLSEHDQK
jgi:Tfp pilus assembly protein PilF/predicted transcriptional regulator